MCRTTIVVFMSALCFASELAASSPAQDHTTDQYAQLRQRWSEYFLGNPQLPWGLAFNSSLRH